jgi:hypothetical protein
MLIAWDFLCLFNLLKRKTNMHKGRAITTPILGQISMGKSVE